MDVSNWPQLVVELSPALYRYFSACFHITSAEDCVQETLLRLYQKIEGHHYDSSLGSIRMYAYGIARFVKLETRKTRPTLEYMDQDLISEAEEGDNPHSNLEYKRRIQALRSAMNSLSEIQQEVLQLYIDQELSLVEIGNILEIPSGTVKSHVFRAKEKLKELLSEQMEEAK